MAQTLLQAQGVQPPASSRGTTTLVQKLMQMGTPLGQYAGGKMYYGIKTGLNEAFVIDEATRDRLVAEDPRSSEVLKPYLRGRDVARYTLNPTELWLIFARHGINIQQYPAIERYLSQFREELQPKQRGQKGKGRKPGPYKWYEIQDSVDYYQIFELPKIVSIRFGLQNGFAYDGNGFYCNDAIYNFSPGTKWITAVLNSSVCNICLISVCPSVQNGYSQFFVNKIEQLPIVEPAPADQTRLAALVDQLQAMGGQGSDAEQLEHEVDAIVYRTYGLSEEEIAEIERWHAERRAQLGTGRRGQRIMANEEVEA